MVNCCRLGVSQFFVSRLDTVSNVVDQAIPSPAPRTPVALFAEPPPEDHDYRPISGLAVTASVLGVLSIAAVFHPALCVLPALGAASGALALRGLLRADSRAVGRWPALIGLALSLCLGVLAPAELLTRTWIRNRTAERVAARWADAILGSKILEAHSLLMPFARLDLKGEEESVSGDMLDSAKLEAAYRQRLEVAAMLACGATKREAPMLREYVPESKAREEVWVVRIVIAPCIPGKVSLPEGVTVPEKLCLDIEVESALMPRANWWYEQWYVKKVTVTVPEAS